MPLWDGRFSGSSAEAMVRFSESLDVDLQMWREDITGSRAHVRMLGECGLVRSDEVQALLDVQRLVPQAGHAGLDRVAEELASGAFRPDRAHEDIHMAVEARLTELVGEVGGKLHTARSRNDQVATDVRLWLRERLGGLRAALVDLVRALLLRVERDGDVLIPGFTHLQRGQPILLGHHLLAYAWMIRRDAGRVDDALSRLDACPLGACAMAGTPHPIDRHRSAALLGFSAPIDNAMDAVAARDHLCEAASACAIAMTHLSRMAEELVLWSSAEFALVRISDAWTTGSSIMPQKRNPDAAELVRGKSARVLGALQALLVMVKGLPLAYNRDLQEDRGALFDAVATTTACATVMAAQWRALEVARDRYEAALQGDFLLATELADHLVEQGVPFREAHSAAGRAVAWCEARGGNLSLLDLDALRSIEPRFGDDALACLDPRGAAHRRRSFGGTAPEEIARQVDVLSAWVASG